MSCSNRCRFCFIPQYEIIEETDNFRAIIDINPLTDEHILIISKEHIHCAATISNIEEYIKLKRKYKDSIFNKYGKIAMYEHGRVGACKFGDDECEHFHLNLLPVDCDISTKITHPSVLPPIIIESHEELVQNYQKYSEYLYFAVGEREYFFPVVGDIPSSFMRTIIAQCIGKPELADWRRISKLNI